MMEWIKRSFLILIAIATLMLLYLSSLYNYLLFHSIAEIFSICIAITVFFITWNSRNIIKNNYLILVGIAYLFIGILDFSHTISYQGMNIIARYEYHANQLWIAARYFESIILLLSFILLKSKKKINVYLLFGNYSVVTAAIILSVFVWHIFPICYIEGVGQTTFKIVSEYIIILILISAIFMLRRNRETFSSKVYRLLFFSLISMIATEFCFTIYVSNYGFMNLLGHYFKIASFFLIYRAIIQTGISEPYNLIFRELKQAEHQLYKQNQELSDQVVNDSLTISGYINLLEQNTRDLSRQSKMLEILDEAIFAWDLNGVIIYWNKGAELTFGFAAEEAIGQKNTDILKVEYDISFDKVKLMLECDCNWTGEFEYITKDGSTLCIETKRQLYCDSDGREIILEISHDVTHRKIMETELKRQTAELREKNRLITDFFINISHEFKTPLAIILIQLELMRLYINDPNKLSGYVSMTTQNIYRLSRLVSNILDITKHDAGFMKLSLTKMDVIALIKDIFLSVESYANAKHIKMVFETGLNNKTMQVDVEKLERIILNLLSNSIKHSAKGGSIKLKVEEGKENGISISVEDKGEGIPKEMHEKIFDRFAQIDSSFTRKTDGCGIGLSIVKAFVGLLGGSIDLISEVGIGSTFTIHLPELDGSEDLMLIDGFDINKKVAIELSDLDLENE